MERAELERQDERERRGAHPLPVAERRRRVGGAGEGDVAERVRAPRQEVRQLERPREQDRAARERREARAHRRRRRVGEALGAGREVARHPREEQPRVERDGAEADGAREPEHPAERRRRVRERQHARAHHLGAHRHRRERPRGAVDARVEELRRRSGAAALEPARPRARARARRLRVERDAVPLAVREQRGARRLPRRPRLERAHVGRLPAQPVDGGDAGARHCAKR